jgi:hypothetical protein
MSDIKSGTVTIKATGEQYRYEVKRSWSRLYYSFDFGATWHPTKGAAYRVARDSGTLHRVGEVKVSVAA